MGIEGSKLLPSHTSSRFNYFFKLINESQTLMIEDELNNNSKAKNFRLCNQKNNSGATLLMFAAYNGNIELLDALLKNGSDTSLRDNEGKTVLFYLINSKLENRQKAVRILLENKCPIDQTDFKLTTCLHEAVKANDTELVKILVEEDANVNLTDEDGISPLNRAVDNCNIEIVKLLLNKKINVNQIDKNGLTALHIASVQNDVEIIKLLINKGANINVKDNSMNTPLTLAKLIDSRDAIIYLRKFGVKEAKLKRY